MPDDTQTTEIECREAWASSAAEYFDWRSERPDMPTSAACLLSSVIPPEKMFDLHQPTAAKEMYFGTDICLRVGDSTWSVVRSGRYGDACIEPSGCRSHRRRWDGKA